MWIAFALTGSGRAFADTDPARALDAFHQALVLTQEQRIPFLEARVAQESAGLEIIHGDRDKGLELFDVAIDSYHRAGNHVDLAATLADLAVFFDRDGQPDIAATIYGTSTHYWPRRPGSSTFPPPWTTCAPCSATPSSTSVSPPGRRWNRPTPSATPATRFESPARRSGRRRERRVAAVGDGDVSVHRYRGFDASLGGRP